MKAIYHVFFSIVLLAAVLAVAGCKGKQVSPYGNRGAGIGSQSGGLREGRITEEVRPSEERFGGPVVEGLDAMGGAGSLQANSEAQSDAYKREHGRSSPEMQPIYFDFDQSAIRADQIPRMEHNATTLHSMSGRRVVIEGNTDSRGTNEYNLGLSERRAFSAKQYLMELGIAADRIRTMSYGEERPLFHGDNEQDYAANRRDDFILE